MSGQHGSEAQPIGDVLDGLGIVAGLDGSELVAGAVVLLKVLQVDGQTRLSVVNSEGLGWIERVGMLRVAEASETAMAIGTAER